MVAWSGVFSVACFAAWSSARFAAWFVAWFAAGSVFAAWFTAALPAPAFAFRLRPP